MKDSRQSLHSIWQCLGAGIFFSAWVTAGLGNDPTTFNAPGTALAAKTASFQALGQMPGGWAAAGTYATNLSSDGSAIVGYGWVCPNGQPTCTSSEKTEAYRWTMAGGYQRLGDLGNS